MKRTASIILVSGLVLAAAGLTSCGKKDSGTDTTNLVEMNASDGSMNDMTVVESATLDQAGAAAAAADNEASTENVSNAM